MSGGGRSGGRRPATTGYSAATPLASENSERVGEGASGKACGRNDRVMKSGAVAQFSIARFAGFVRERSRMHPSASRWAILSRPLRGLWRQDRRTVAATPPASEGFSPDAATGGRLAATTGYSAATPPASRRAPNASGRERAVMRAGGTTG
jgi:hypothetical protein